MFPTAVRLEKALSGSTLFELVDNRGAKQLIVLVS
jgi:hypothetical protein